MFSPFKGNHSFNSGVMGNKVWRLLALPATNIKHLKFQFFTLSLPFHFDFSPLAIVVSACSFLHKLLMHSQWLVKYRRRFTQVPMVHKHFKHSIRKLFKWLKPLHYHFAYYDIRKVPAKISVFKFNVPTQDPSIY